MTSPLINSKGYAIIGTYMSSNNNASNEYEHDLAIISTTYETKNISKKLHSGTNFCVFKTITPLKYMADRILKKWLDRKNFTEMSRLYTQAIPNTILNSRGGAILMYRSYTHR